MGIFREKSLDRVSGPEELNDYIRVASPSVWLILTALVILLLGMLIWSITSEIEVHNEDGTMGSIRPIEFVIN